MFTGTRVGAHQDIADDDSRRQYLAMTMTTRDIERHARER